MIQIGSYFNRRDILYSKLVTLTALRNRKSRIIAVTVLSLSLILCNVDQHDKNKTDKPDSTPISVIEHAYKNKISNIQIVQEGTIVSVLDDDTVGARHQRFIIRLSNEQTLLIAHNIDLAPRVPNLVCGARVKFCGEYEWNSKGGVVHWTHKDPDGKHVDGWIEYKGKRYD
jgi:hypothetical protein